MLFYLLEPTLATEASGSHTREQREYWELFDRLKDKQEMNNVYNNLEYAKIIKDLKIKLKDLRATYKNTDELDQQLFEKSTKTYLSKQ